ncbi:MAG: hypothetical protein NTY19_36685 [Planctomycetota bacterium]|nr:hypothetical protein [Planctomycetota bacterium]
MATVMTSHVWLDERGVAWLDDANVKVLEVAMEQFTHGCVFAPC